MKVKLNQNASRSTTQYAAHRECSKKEERVSSVEGMLMRPEKSGLLESLDSRESSSSLS
jgi:hypothetical protein